VTFVYVLRYEVGNHGRPEVVQRFQR
jgi:hypothetical protein